MPIKILSLAEQTEETRLVADGSARVRRWKDLSAKLGSLDYLTLQPGGEAVGLYFPDAEDSYYAISGQGTLLDLAGDRAVPFAPGTFLHVPAGVRHSLQATGDQPAVLVGGPCPPSPNRFDHKTERPHQRPLGEAQAFSTSEGVEVPLIRPPMPGGFARFPIWPGMGANLRSMNCVVMRPGQENVPHVHPVSEDIFYCLSGTCVIEDGDTGKELPFTGGCLIFIDPGTPHAVKSLGPDDYVSVGGPCPPDLAIFRRFGLLRG